MAVPNVSEIVDDDPIAQQEARRQRQREQRAADAAVEGRAHQDRGGGDVIMQELFFANGTVKNYTGYETLDISPSEVISAAQFDWKQKAVAVTISGLDQLKNSGKERMIDLLEARIENAEQSIKNSIATDMYSDGTADGGKQIGGLQFLVADTPTNTVGGIDRNSAISAFFKNKVFDCSSSGGSMTKDNVQGYMNALWVQLVRGADKPDLIVADNNYFGFYWASLQPLQRFTDPNGKLASLGFERR